MAKDRTVPVGSGPVDESASSANLAALGIGADEEQVYRVLLRSPGRTVSELTEALDLGPVRLRWILDSLERSGLVSRTSGASSRYLPAAPDVGLEALILDRVAELERVRGLAETWMTEYREGRWTGPTELIELVTGSEAVLHRFDQLQRSAAEEIQVLDTPPYAGPAGPSPNDVEFEVLRRGVTCKAIYDRAALERAPNAVNAILRYVAAGEQARVTSRLPLKLATFDRKLAFVPQSVQQQDVASAIVVHPCSLLDVLLYVFDQLWSQATPLSLEPPHVRGQVEPPPQDEPGPDERRLLALLSSGMKDAAIAHHLGWSYRTTRRRIAALLTSLGVETRFQAGLYAARRGWL
ncbi:helix-turn-helix transcriptional regulator [Flindersiella endophytica]